MRLSERFIELLKQQTVVNVDGLHMALSQLTELESDYQVALERITVLNTKLAERDCIDACLSVENRNETK